MEDVARQGRVSVGGLLDGVTCRCTLVSTTNEGWYSLGIPWARAADEVQGREKGVGSAARRTGYGGVGEFRRFAPLRRGPPCLAERCLGSGDGREVTIATSHRTDL